MFRTELNLETSATVAINSIALEKKSRGERVYNLSAGEPMLLPHPLVQSAAEEAIRAGHTLYPPVAGLPELRSAASSWINTTYGTNFSIEETLITCGGKFAIFAALQASIRPDDEVIIISPYWVSYPALVRLFGGKPVIVETTATQNWAVSVDLITKAVTERTKMIIINNGGNPTGVLYDKTTVEQLVTLAVEHNIILLSDEVYSGLTYDDGVYTSAGAFTNGHEHVVVVQSCSKHFAMTGWRVGVVFGPVSFIKILTQIQGQSTTGTSSVSQWAAVAAFKNAEEIMTFVRTEMAKRRNIFITTFNQLFKTSLSVPKAGLYNFFPLTALEISTTDSKRFCLETLEQGSVALVPGIAFGQEGFVRASFGATEQELVESLNALRTFLIKAID